MKPITRNIVGPESKLYSAKFMQAESMEEVTDVITSLGLSLEDVNSALRKAKKAIYIAALEATPDSLLADAMASFVKIGFSLEEAKTFAESKRASLGTGLPVGLTDLNRVSKRGRKSEAEKAAEAEKQSKAPKAKTTK